MATNFLIESAIQIFLQPKRSIGGISATVTVEEVGEDELKITDHPVEQGAEITDNAYKEPAKLRITALWGNTLISKTPGETYQQLLNLQSSRIPFDIITGKRKYSNMLFKTLKQTTDKNTENCLSITADFKEIVIVDVQVTSVPPRANQAQPQTTGATENAGTKAPQPVSATANTSTLFSQVRGQ